MSREAPVQFTALRIRERNLVPEPSNSPLCMQQRLKSPPRSARTRVITTELLQEFFPSTHDAITALHMGLGREALPTLATDLESTRLRSVLS